jgi:hypothetical protein
MPVPKGAEDTFGPWPGALTPDGGEPSTTQSPDGQEQIEFGGVPFWKDAVRIYDRVVIAGFEFPGLARVKGELRRKLDKKAPKGVNGGTTTDDGEDHHPVEVEIRLYTREDWQRFELIVPFISPKSLGKRVAVTIDYPTLALFGINTIYVESVTIPDFVDDKRQHMVCTIRANEWRPPPKPAPSKSSTAKESADNAKEAYKSGGQAAKSYGSQTGTDAYGTPLDEYGMGTGTRTNDDP